jgi:acetyl-CoA synthetase
VLGRFGIGTGDVVATLAGRIPCLYVAALGTLKNRSVYTPLYSAFGPDPIVSRMTIARARMLVTTDVLYRRKVEPVRRADARAGARVAGP